MEIDISKRNEDRQHVVDALVSASTMDLLYADLYLYRAEALLPVLCTRRHYQEIRKDRERLPKVTNELRHACAQQDWARVRSIAQEALAARERVSAAASLFATADAVYGPRPVRADAIALGLSGVVAQPDGLLSRARAEIADRLEWLASRDPDWTDFYRSRRQHFDELRDSGSAGPEPVEDPARLQRRIAEAIDQGNFKEIDKLTSSALADPQGPSRRLRVPLVAQERIDRLSSAFPHTARERGRRIGLEEVSLPPAKGLNEYLGCCCADRARFADEPLGEGSARHEDCTCGHACPPDVRPKLRENLDFLIGHPFITSTGVRYLPWFGAETILVEDFPEEERDAHDGVLKALGLPARCGVPRLQIEDALLSRGPDVCGGLGLDPAECMLVCVPFDAYHRLAPRYAWGRTDFWTHFDGYQVTRELRLLALVGGYARFGGPDDISTIARSYDSEKIVARFAVVRRDRFVARQVAAA